jgi:glycosyltransferase involved in cell wall biosynthesis
VVAEFYPRRSDPVLGIWAHRQALAAQAAGAELRVLVLHRVVPPQHAVAAGGRQALSALRTLLAQPRHDVIDGMPVQYVRYVAPIRERGYHRWGAWGAPALALALRALRRSFDFDLVHAHNAVPAGDAVRRARMRVPVVVSVHGGDVLYTARRGRAAERAVADGLAGADLVLANSGGIAELARGDGARRTRVVHLGTDLPPTQPAAPSPPPGTFVRRRPPTPTLVTVGHLVARKRHADVVRALSVLGRRHPALRYLIIGDGPERAALLGLAERLGVAERVELAVQLAPAAALARAREATIFVMPSTEEAFGVAYIEAMAAGLPAIGCRGEPGPEEIAKAGDGMILVPPGDIERLSQRLDELLSDSGRLRLVGRHARTTVSASFTWERCGRETVDAYRSVLGR